jgi:site-specific recombinase XerD
MMWEKIILPRFGKMKVAQITHDDVDALHRDITEIRGTPVRANRTVEVLRKAFNLAIRWKWRDDNPASGVRRNQEEKRNRYLNRTEIAALAQALNDHSEPMSANAIKLLMLTWARRGRCSTSRTASGPSPRRTPSSASCTASRSRARPCSCWSR